MSTGQSADSDLRNRKCGSHLNNNKHGNVDDLTPSQVKAQNTRQPNTEHSQPNDNSQQTDMSTTSKSKPHHSSLGESSAEDLDSGNDSTMWRNEIQQRDELQQESVSVPAQKLSASKQRRKYSNMVDILIRMVIVVIFFKLETTPAFKRVIHPEELWLYKNPRRPDIVKSGDLLFLVISVPLFLTLLFYVFTKDRRDFRAASWAWTMAVCMNGIPTSLLKITVGRPRPDFFFRCFPDGVMVLNETSSDVENGMLDFNCTGIPSEINEGRKSFPSGHSSFAFASFGFVAYYVGAKLHAFDARGRGQTWRLCVAVMPLIAAALVAVSRTCDYHHHWQDVFFGGIIGLATGYFSYRQYYPSIFSTEAGRPFSRYTGAKDKSIVRDSEEKSSGEIFNSLVDKESSKWY